MAFVLSFFVRLKHRVPQTHFHNVSHCIDFSHDRSYHCFSEACSRYFISALHTPYSELLQRLQQLQLDLSTSASTSGLTAATCRVCDLHRTSFCSPTCSSTSGLNHGEIIDDKLTWTSTSSYMYEYDFLHQIHVLERSTRAEYRVPDLMANLVHSGRDTFWPFSRRVRPRSYN